MLYTWSGMAGADTPLSAGSGHCVDLTVQVTGTFGTTTVTLQGSMDDTTYATLNDTAGTPAALSFTANGFTIQQAGTGSGTIDGLAYYEIVPHQQGSSSGG